MMGDVVIRAEGLGKRYWIGGAARADSLRDTLASALTAPLRRAAALARGHGSAAETGHQALWALRDAAFTVRRGESLGIIGRNGAGKSTLLKILSRITEPTAGHVDLTGRVASLLEVGTGFHPDLTGEENIYLNGAILGMSRREIKQRFGEIAAFAGVEKFLRTAVKHYSSGMYTRLAFSVAAHLESEILIVDEVLAVGDAEFQRRCLDRMGDITHGGRTVLFVSHNLAAVESLCRSCILLEGGRIVERGEPAEVVHRYLRRQQHTDAAGWLTPDRPRHGSGKIRFTACYPEDDRGTRLHALEIGCPGRLTLEWHHDHGQLQRPQFVVDLATAVGQKITRLSTLDTGTALPNISTSGSVRVRMPEVCLMPGRYLLTLHVRDHEGVVDHLENTVPLEVSARDVFGSGKLPPGNKGFIFFVPQTWQMAAAGDEQPAPVPLELEAT